MTLHKYSSQMSVPAVLSMIHAVAQCSITGNLRLILNQYRAKGRLAPGGYPGPIDAREAEINIEHQLGACAAPLLLLFHAPSINSHFCHSHLPENTRKSQGSTITNRKNMSSHEDQEPYSPSPAPLSEDEMDFEDNGLRFDGIPQGLEKIWDYAEGGHHPVCLNDRLGDRGQFQVIHKLGSGGYANVWLCRVLDANPSEYIALKILMADSSGADCPERTILQFQQLVQDEPTVAKYFSLLLHQFQIDGPNGTHLCFV